MALLRVTAWLSTAVAAREQVCLDGLLVAAHPDTGHHLTRACSLDRVQIPRLPIVSKAAHGHRVWLASAWEMQSAQVGLERIIKRKDAHDIEERDKPWTPSSGPEKNCMIPLPMALTPSVSWLAVGDRRGVIELLRNLPAIGSVRRHGHGVVREWEVERIDGDPVDALVRDGKARRFVPASWCASAAGIESGPVSPPYWHPRMVTQRVRPGVDCVLRADVVAMVRECH